MTIPQEAIEAGAKAMSDDWNPDRDPILTAMFRDYATSALTAALPALERVIREKVAQEIEGRIVMEFDEFDVLSNITARDYARLARGKEHQ